MSFLLKIVDGPNKGAEVALVEGVAVTLGKGDDCDIVLADQTMPDAPLVVEANAERVTVGGDVLEAFRVKTVGETSFAVGPSGAPWGELVWPKAEVAADAADGKAEGDEPEGEAREDAAAGAAAAGAKDARPRRRRCLGCLAVLLLAALALSAVAWFHREKSKEVCKVGYAKIRETCGGWRLRWSFKAAEPAVVVEKPTLEGVAARYGLELSEEDGGAKLYGNLKTRRERLAATAEAYAAQPGVDIDISDDESLRASAEDALFTLTEGALKLSAATNRFLSISGRAASASALRKTIEALNADMPKLRGVDVSGVALGGLSAGSGARDERSVAPHQSHRVPRPERKSSASSPSLPVCGILTTPYPCIITRDGRRYLEGAVLADSVVVKIEADSVVLTNSTGRFTWKP